VQHFHAHLDVAVGGKAVVVPAGVGIDQIAQKLTSVHTHTPDGIIHIESPEADAVFTLGQVWTLLDTSRGYQFSEGL
jgi:hypothetical protein